MNLNTISGLRIRLASPELIRSWSHGEVTKPDTINYLTNKPEKGGLFCERIFGPVKDWTCACRRYRRERSPGFVCGACGVEVAPSRVRRERMGHIELVVPVAHSWFAHGRPSILAILLGLSQRQLASVLAYTDYVVTQIDEAKRDGVLSRLDKANKTEHQLHRLLETLAVGDFLDEEQYRRLGVLAHPCLYTQTGAEAIRCLLNAIDLTKLAASLRRAISEGKGNQKKMIKRLHIAEAFRRSGVDPAWMVLSVLPVLPPDLRPLVDLSGGRFAASDLNILYGRVIHCNQRVQRFIDHGAPDSMLNYEKRLLQDACDALFDNTRGSHPLMEESLRPLKSLTDALHGKRGQFRRNLLGKRVDYSGRSVICVGLDLQLPRDMQRDNLKR